MSLTKMDRMRTKSHCYLNKYFWNLKPRKIILFNCKTSALWFFLYLSCHCYIYLDLNGWNQLNFIVHTLHFHQSILPFTIIQKHYFWVEGKIPGQTPNFPGKQGQFKENYSRFSEKSKIYPGLEKNSSQTIIIG